MSSRSNRIVLTNNTRIGNYKIIDLLGQGGYGDVYKVENIINGKIFALKTEYLNAQKKALEKEINFLKQLDSPYFPHIYAEGTDGNVFYCVMDLFGKSIANCKKLNKIDPPILMTMGIEMIKAIQAFHEAGFIHRDIKPDNFAIGYGKKSHFAKFEEFF